MPRRQSKSLCEAFMKISRGVRMEIDKSFKLGFPYAEETVTQRVLFRLAEEQPQAVRVVALPFSKREEGDKGADFDLWITEKANGSNLWLGLRVQAKIIDHKTGRFKHLFYFLKKLGVYQVERLINSAIKDKALPIYLLYIGKNPLGNPPAPCPYGRFSHQWANWWLSAEYVKRNTGKRGADSLREIVSNSVIRPWQCFACCPLFVGQMRPRIFAFPKFFQIVIQENNGDYAAQILEEPPRYVRLAYEKLFREAPSDTGDTEEDELITSAMAERGLEHLAILDLSRLEGPELLPPPSPPWG